MKQKQHDSSSINAKLNLVVTMLSKMDKGFGKRLAMLETERAFKLAQNVPKKRNTSVTKKRNISGPKKRKTSVPLKRNRNVSKKSGLRARNLSDEEESASSEDSEDVDEDEKIALDSEADEEDTEADTESEEEVHHDEGESIGEKESHDQEEKEEDDDEEDNDDDDDNCNDDDADDDQGGNNIGKDRSENDHNSGNANAENNLQIVVASSANAEEVTIADNVVKIFILYIFRRVTVYNFLMQPIQYLDKDEEPQVEEDFIDGAQYDKVLVKEKTNENKDYDEGDGYIIGNVDDPNKVVSGVIGELNVDHLLDVDRTVTDDVEDAPKEEMTQQTTSMVLHDCHKNVEEDNACVGVYGVHIEKQDSKTGGVGTDKMDGEDQIGSMAGYDAESNEHDSLSLVVQEEKMDDTIEADNKGGEKPIGSMAVCEADIDDHDSQSLVVMEEKMDDTVEADNKGEGEEADKNADIGDGDNAHEDHSDNMVKEADEDNNEKEDITEGEGEEEDKKDEIGEEENPDVHVGNKMDQDAVKNAEDDDKDKESLPKGEQKKAVSPKKLRRNPSRNVKPSASVRTPYTGDKANILKLVRKTTKNKAVKDMTGLLHWLHSERYRTCVLYTRLKTTNFSNICLFFQP